MKTTILALSCALLSSGGLAARTSPAFADDAVPLSSDEIMALANGKIVEINHSHGYRDLQINISLAENKTLTGTRGDLGTLRGGWTADEGKLCLNFVEKNKQCGRILKQAGNLEWEREGKTNLILKVMN